MTHIFTDEELEQYKKDQKELKYLRTVTEESKSFKRKAAREFFKIVRKEGIKYFPPSCQKEYQEKLVKNEEEDDIEDYFCWPCPFEYLYKECPFGYQKRTGK